MFLKKLKNKRIDNPSEKTLIFMAKYADKYKVKEIVQSRCPDLKIAKVLGIYSKFEDINVKQLPQKFVIKVNHWSGDATVITSHEEFLNKYDELAKYFNNILTKKFTRAGEKHYSLIKPVLFIEEYLSKNIKEVKLHVIWGIPIFIDYIEYKRNLFKCYDMNWNELNFHNTHAYGKNKISIDTSTRQPVQSFELFNYCRNLCEDIDYVRLDFYLTEDDTVYFGEYTFTPTALNKYYTSDKIYDIMYNMYKTKNIDLSKIDELIK